MSVVQRSDMQCEEALRLLAEYLDRELAPEAGARLSTHLETCRSCYSRAEFEGKLKGKLRELAIAQVDPSFEQRIRQLVTSFTRQDPDTTR